MIKIKQKIINNICPFIILFTILFVLASICCNWIVTSADGFKHNKGTFWDTVNNTLDASKDDTYPYDTSSAKVTSVSLDHLFGIQRGLVTYHGELPYEETHDEDGNWKDAAGEGINSKEGTKTSDEDYFGRLEDEIDTESYPITGTSSYEEANKDEVVSLRLYALSNTWTGWFDLSNVFYMMFSYGARFAGWILKLVIMLKNIDMETIMDALNLKSLYNLFTKTFIYNSDTKTISVFVAIALIFFMFAIVAFVFKYVRGKLYAKGLVDIVSLALIAALIIGMCLSGKLWTLGSSFSNIATKLMGAVSGSVSGIGGAFTTEIDDDENENKIIQMQEETIINKTYMDIQICTQFGVTKVDNLTFEKLGDEDGSIAKNTLITGNKSSDKGTVDLEENFNNNLGYYFWYADSSVKAKPDKNATFPSTNTSHARKKLDSMITYLQKVYNHNVDEGNDNGTIKTIILSFANPNGLKGVIKMLLFTAILIALTICLLMYALTIVINKLGLFMSMVGMTIAGPLILTTNEKLVKTGKAILGNILVSIVNITVYSLLFDSILYIIASLLSDDSSVLRMLVTFGLILLFIKIKPVVDKKIKSMLQSFERKYGMGSGEVKNQVKSYARGASNDRINKYLNKERVIGYDADGNEIKGTNRDTKLGLAMQSLHNAAFNEGSGRMANQDRIKKDYHKAQADNKTKYRNERLRNANESYEKAIGLAEADAKRIQNQVEQDVEDFQSEHYTYDSRGNINGYNESNLSAEERQYKSELDAATHTKAEINNNTRYLDLSEKEAEYEAYNAEHAKEEGFEKKSLSAQEKMQLQGFRAKLNNSEDAAKKAEQKLQESINERANDYAYKKNNLTKSAPDSTIETDSKLHAQEANRDNLTVAIGNLKDEAREQTKHKVSDKIGGEKKIDQQAIEAYVTASQAEQELNTGHVISKNLTDENKTIVEEVSRRANNEIDTETSAEQTYFEKNSKEIEDAKEAVKKAETEEDKSIAQKVLDEAKANRKAKKERAKKNKEDRNEAFLKAKENSKDIAGAIDNIMNNQSLKEPFTRTMNDSNNADNLSKTKNMNLSKDQNSQHFN